MLSKIGRSGIYRTTLITFATKTQIELYRISIPVECAATVTIAAKGDITSPAISPTRINFMRV